MEQHQLDFINTFRALSILRVAQPEAENQALAVSTDPFSAAYSALNGSSCRTELMGERLNSWLLDWQARLATQGRPLEQAQAPDAEG